MMVAVVSLFLTRYNIAPHQLEEGIDTAYLFDENSVATFFKKNPDKLPADESTVPKFNRSAN